MAYQGIQGPSSGSSSSSGFQHLNSPFEDTTYTKVFVGGLAWETQSETMRRHFEQFGEILEAVVITDKNTGRSKGYGFVTFGDPEAARRACSDPAPIIDGRRANCNLASLGRPHPPLQYGMLHMDPSMSTHRVSTTLTCNSTFKYMEFLEQLMQPYILLDSWVKPFQVVMVIQQFKDMQCQVIRLYNLVDLSLAR